MNSWKSTLLSAWTPPFKTLNMGTGSDGLISGVKIRKRGEPALAAEARATARETPKMALAPRFRLFSVPSRARRRPSTAA